MIFTLLFTPKIVLIVQITYFFYFFRTFFEFNIEKTISVSQFQQFCDLSLDSDTLITDFLRQNFILKLNVFKPSLDGDDKHQEWREKAL